MHLSEITSLCAPSAGQQTHYILYFTMMMMTIVAIAALWVLLFVYDKCLVVCVCQPRLWTSGNIWRFQAWWGLRPDVMSVKPVMMFPHPMSNTSTWLSTVSRLCVYSEYICDADVIRQYWSHILCTTQVCVDQTVDHFSQHIFNNQYINTHFYFPTG